MTAITVFAIALRSAFMYLSPIENHRIISIISISYAIFVFMIIISIYAYIQIQKSKSKNTAIGEVIDKIEYKNETTYKIKYIAKDCVFMLICNSTDHMEIGAKVSVKYIEFLPFISRIIK